MGYIPTFWRVAIVFLSISGHILFSISERGNFYPLLGLFTVLVVCYILILNEYKLKEVFILAIVLRLIWLFSPPNLSDDYFRFLWDADVLLEEGNPYLSTPSDLTKQDGFSNSYHQKLYRGMNSQDYYTVYPPVNQLTFLASAVFPESLGMRVFGLKLFFFLIEFLALFVLFKLANKKEFNQEKFGLWALNPLVIIEGIGNLHYEVVMLSLVFSAWFVYKKSWQWSAVLLGLAISVKLLPIMFLPLLVPKLGWKKSILYSGLAVLTFIVTFLPFICAEFFSNFWSSIDLYFRSFEFNASIFYIVKYVGELTVGYDIVKYAGPSLALLTVLLIGVLSLWPNIKKKISFSTSLILVSTAYLLFSTTIHPWYIIVPLGISLFTSFKYPVWWSALVFLSYSHYIGEVYIEKPLFIGLEYIVLGIIIFYELRNKKIKSS